MIDYAEQRDRTNRSEMRDRIDRAIRKDGHIEPFEGVRLMRLAHFTEDILGDTKPSVCFIAQGAKELTLGEVRYRYDPEHFLLATVEIPVRSVVMKPSEETPYLGLRVELDPALVGSVMMEAGLVASSNASEAKALCVSRVDSDLLDAATRLVRLLDSPAQAKTLIPQTKREIVYRLLIGAEGHRLRHLPAPGGQTQRIARALEKLRQEFDRPLRIEELAKELGMSSTRFHHHFKAVTDMSPLQFQKQIRLQEARRLMLGEDFDASSAGYRVGYEDPSHFSRDYKRYFGESPMRDVEKLRSMAAAV
ncbi:AraC family transcriptional regulator [bacterium]|nr:MAG: AraC family transcriptional regulator [bacterium]